MGGRIASQVARQVLMQEIREAERNKVYDEYADRVGDIISGTISRRDRGDLVVQLGNQLGKMEAYLPGLEQTRGEQYRSHDRMKFFVVDVRKAGKGPRGPQIIVSRSHPSLLRRLFELEVPEIESGHVLIKSVARDPGQRSKIAVAAKDDRYDPVGSCVGHRGQRVQAVVDELRNEKVDIVRWSPDQRQFIIESLSPAKVVEVRQAQNGWVITTHEHDSEMARRGCMTEYSTYVAETTEALLKIMKKLAGDEWTPSGSPPAVRLV
jgi:N utilization substance protein A